MRWSAHAGLGELVWPGPEGQLLPPSTFYKQWMAMRRRAGIRAVSFHALRHTAATLAIEGGQPLQAVARMLGHSTVTTTMRLYVHATEARAEALADFIDFQYGPGLREWTRNGRPKANTVLLQGKTRAGKGNRTLTPLRAQRPERCVSTSSTTPASDGGDRS
jgi:hypothetical protein